MASHWLSSVSLAMPINQSMAFAEQRFVTSCNLKSITPMLQQFSLNKITAQLRIFLTLQMLSSPRMNHGKRRTFGRMQDLVLPWLAMLLNLNMTKQSSSRVKFAPCKIWATPTQAIRQSSIAPMLSLVSLKRSLCALPFLIKSWVGFDFMNVKRSRIYWLTYAFSLTLMMKSLSAASSTYRNVALAIAR